MASLEHLSDEELEAAIHAASDERAALKERARALTAEADRRVTGKLVENLSDAQKAQLLGVLSVESEESVNGG